MKYIDQKIKITFLLSIILIISLSTYLLFPYGNNILRYVREYSHIKKTQTILPYEPGIDLTTLNYVYSTSTSYQAVPVLMYHGVLANSNATPEILGSNTTRENFIKQMEMLKVQGFNTITVNDFYLWRQGKFILPEKPIILTFDDGRKDSFYTVDEVLKKLGYRATLFVATTKANEEDSFYLSWKELNNVLKSGRWELQAHGRRSHDKIIIDENGTTGRFYTSRIYTPGIGLESVEDYKKRVEEDYVGGVNDLRDHLGIVAEYFAVPFSNYGIHEPYNYPDAYNFNQKLTKKYFKLSFFEVESFESFYNYIDTPSHEIIRLEVQNKTDKELFELLNKFAPKLANVKYDSKKNKIEDLENEIQVLYGDLEHKKNITLSSTVSTPSARLLIGDRGWRDYSVLIDLSREKGRSASVMIYYENENNYISLNWGNEYVWISQIYNGVEKELASYTGTLNKNNAVFKILIYKGKLSVAVDDIAIVNELTVPIKRGATGLAVWDPKKIAKSTINKIFIEQVTSKPKRFNEVAVSEVIETDNKNNSVVVDDAPVSIVEEVVVPKTLPFYSTNLNIEDWKKTWGGVSYQDGVMSVGAISSTTGGGVLLKGSNLWEDYEFKTKIDWLKNGDYTLLARYKDDGNYVSCSYHGYGSGAVLTNVVNGKTVYSIENYELAIPYFAPWVNINLGIRVVGNHVECLINDEWVLKSDLDSLERSGSVGIETWDKQKNNITILVKEASVKKIEK